MERSNCLKERSSGVIRLFPETDLNLLRRFDPQKLLDLSHDLQRRTDGETIAIGRPVHDTNQHRVEALKVQGPDLVRWLSQRFLQCALDAIPGATDRTPQLRRDFGIAVALLSHQSCAIIYRRPMKRFVFAGFLPGSDPEELFP
ncbi:hypothetical protein [Gemmobacter denitrificans]|uniref:Uncharacterized protein n=1 Tax=Gemmobacter denitrificans TaxID=3123040 RepID=A0ABU8BQ61_9RHOB